MIILRGEKMKNILLLIIFLLFISQAYSIAGFGLKFNQTIFSIDANTNSIGDFGRYGNDVINGGMGFGGYFYIDAIPIIDLDLEFSGFGTTYDYFLIIGDKSATYSLPYGSLGGYLTFQKTVFQLAVPLLAKAKLTVGVGLNNQTYKSVPSQSDIETLAGSGLTSSSSIPTKNAFIKFVKKNTNTVNGYHFQTGIQFKIFMLDSFFYYRQVFIDDVILRSKGFGSVNLRLGMGF